MTTPRKIEIFSAGCPLYEDTIALVHRIATSAAEISILDMHDPAVAKRAKQLHIDRVPAVVIDGKPAGTGTEKQTYTNFLTHTGFPRRQESSQERNLGYQNRRETAGNDDYEAIVQARAQSLPARQKKGQRWLPRRQYCTRLIKTYDDRILRYGSRDHNRYRLRTNHDGAC